MKAGMHGAVAQEGLHMVFVAGGRENTLGMNSNSGR